MHYVALSERAAASLLQCVETQPPARVTTEGELDRAVAHVGAAWRQCQAAAEEALEQQERARLRGDGWW